MYGSGDRWPVKMGDIWQVGPHYLACGDLSVHHFSMSHVGAPQLAMAFSCAPNRPSRVESFMAVHMAVEGDVYIECPYSRRFDFIQALRPFGALLEEFTMVGGATSILRCTFSGRTRLEPGQLDLRSMTHQALPATVIEAGCDRGEAVFDASFGCNLTPLAAVRLGRVFVGVDSQPGVVAMGIDQLAANLTTADVRRVGRLHKLPRGKKGPL